MEAKAAGNVQGTQLVDEEVIRKVGTLAVKQNSILIKQIRKRERTRGIDISLPEKDRKTPQGWVNKRYL